MLKDTNIASRKELVNALTRKRVAEADQETRESLCET